MALAISPPQHENPRLEWLEGGRRLLVSILSAFCLTRAITIYFGLTMPEYELAMGCMTGFTGWYMLGFLMNYLRSRDGKTILQVITEIRRASGSQESDARPKPGEDNVS